MNARIRPAIVAAIAVAVIATGSAYLAMVSFGTDVLTMTTGIAFATAGVFELSLVTVALLAREAAQQNRPNGVLLVLTWFLSGSSGVFAAWHEIYLGHEIGAAAFRFLVPLLAALMWHLALIGDRHLATGRTWSSRLQDARLHAWFLATDAERRARQDQRDRGGWLAGIRVGWAQRRRLRTRAVALRTVPPAEVAETVALMRAALVAMDQGTAEAVALADEDAARMTIYEGLGARFDVLNAPVRRSNPATQPVQPAEPIATSAPTIAPAITEQTKANIRTLRAQRMPVRDVATLLGVSTSTVSKYARTGEIPIAQEARA